MTAAITTKTFILQSEDADHQSEIIGSFTSRPAAEKAVADDIAKTNTELGWTLAPPKRWKKLSDDEWLGEVDAWHWYVISEHTVQS